MGREARTLLMAALLCAVVLAGATRTAEAADKGGTAKSDCCNINLFYGFKGLEEDDWAPVDSHTEWGLLTTWGSPTWKGIGIAVDYLQSKDTATEVVLDLPIEIEGKTTEIDVGARFTAGKKSFRPFVGIGLASIKGEFKGGLLGVSTSQSDTGWGLWIDGGVGWRLAKHLNLGLEARWSTASITLFDVDGNAGGFHIGAFIGAGF
jgi:hypothetical protein